MRILVISLPRTGSTSFSKQLAEQNSYPLVFEPFAPMAKLFNKYNNFETDYTKDNVVVKTLINDEYDIDWLIEFINTFDAVHLLSRRNLTECIESWSYLTYKRSETQFGFDSDYYWEKTPNYSESASQILRWNTKLNELSDKINVPITYYEDIFDSTKNRLRKGDKQSNKKIV